MTAKTYAILNYGCQMNESDAEHYAGQLQELGYKAAEDFHDADVVVVNTCCVRESAEKRILGKIGELKGVKANHPGQIVCVAGCMAQKDGEKLIKKHPQIDLLIGTAHVNGFKEILSEYLSEKGERVYNSLEVKESEFEGERIRQSGFSAWIPIMYGCNNFCTYCIVPYTRGRERSRDIESILNEIRDMHEKGFKEVTLLGQNVNSYSFEKEGETITFPILLDRVAKEVPDMRIRFTTSHPKDMSDDTLRVIAANDNICKFIHLPAQSGSSRILKVMNRKYTREWYLDRIAAIRRIVPDCAISTDLFCGFHSETEEDYQETLSLMREVGYDSAFLFKYSERPGTYAASHLEDNVPEEEKVRRLQGMIDLQNKLSEESNLRDIGKTFEVLIEGFSKRSREQLFGRTSQNKVVIFDKKNYHVGQFIKVKIHKASSATLFGEPVEE